MKALILALVALISSSAFAASDGLVSRINRELNKEKQFPKQWLKRNQGTDLVLTEAEMACFKKQKTQMDKAAADPEVQAKLKQLKVPRMTFHLLTGSNDRSPDFRWNAPRRYNAPGGNYLIVKFGLNGGRCFANTAAEISERIKDGRFKKRRPFVLEEDKEAAEKEAKAAAVKARKTASVTPVQLTPAAAEAESVDEGESEVTDPSPEQVQAILK